MRSPDKKTSRHNATLAARLLARQHPSPQAYVAGVMFVATSAAFKGGK
jgi:hypothetical protein